VGAELTGSVQPYLEGASLLLGSGNGVVLPGIGAERDLPFTGAPARLDELAGLDPKAAASLLRALRAGAARLRIGYTGAEARR
jgi:hypothetical protein